MSSDRPHPRGLERPPHPATVVQPSGRPPHPATVVQRAHAGRPPHAATVWPSRPAHPAAVAQTRAAQGPFGRAPQLIAQRALEIAKERPLLHRLTPGVAVLLLKDMKSGDDFVKFIGVQIDKILETEVGKEILAEFNPKNVGLPEVDGGKEEGKSKGKYADIRLVICPVEKGATPLHTRTFGGTDAATGKAYAGTASEQLPRIDIWDVSLGNFDKGGRVITKNGIEAHPDKPKDDPVWPFDVVMFHELCHAYLHVSGINAAIAKHARYGVVEEYFVTGLAEGIGWRYSENTYRGQIKMKARTTYKEHGITSPDAGEFVWGKNNKSRADILKALGL
jgi:hypothetical protein